MNVAELIAALDKDADPAWCQFPARLFGPQRHPVMP